MRAALAALTVLLATSTARADAIVTACSVDTQAGAGTNLAQALAAGGVIRFACPGGTAIRVTGRYALAGSTLIDGGGVVTLDGHGMAGPFLSGAQNIILRQLTLRGFAQPLAHPAAPGAVSSIGRLRGSVLAESANAELDHVSVETSDSPIAVGNATVKDSAFVGNRGIALMVTGNTHLERSRFTGNVCGLSMQAGWVRRSDFTGQTACAISIHAPSGPVEIRHSTFTSTRGRPALELSQHSARGSAQTITVRASTFRDNDGGASGGAVAVVDDIQTARERGLSAAQLAALEALPRTSFMFAYNQFEANRGGRGGAIAADLASTGSFVSTGDLFVGNVAGADGGAVFVKGGAMQITHALFKANRAGGSGAALAVAADASAVLANALVIGNSGPSGAIAGGAVMLTNVTVADNDAAGVQSDTHDTRIANTILAHNHPTDCAGLAAGATRGGNLQSDGSCAGMPTGDAVLDSFYVPMSGSPAFHAGDAALCRGNPVGGVDLTFQGRLGPTACTLGAFEQAPVRKLSGRTDRAEIHATAQDDFSDDEGYAPPPIEGGNR